MLQQWASGGCVRGCEFGCAHKGVYRFQIAPLSSESDQLTEVVRRRSEVDIERKKERLI